MHWILAILRLAVLITAYVVAVTGDAGAAGLRRLALVIANADYVHTPTLKNPPNDATLITGKLKGLGFDVQLETDVGAERFSKILEKFSTKLDKETEVLFYYAGHGLQFRGENFLVGIDARLNSEATLQFETFNLNTILHLLEEHASTTLLFWDACRNNPLAVELLRSSPGSSSENSAQVRGGAAALPARRGDTLIVFSAEPGKEALDGPGDYSPFAESLGQHIGTPNLEIELMLKHVSAEVRERTHDVQWPQRLSQLTHEFYFRRDAGAELAYEEEIKRLNKKIEELQRGTIPRNRLMIVPSSDSDTPKSGRILPMSTAPSVQTRSAGPQSAPVPQGAVERDVVVTVDSATSTVIRKLRVSPNGKLLALGDEDGWIRIVSLETFEVAATFQAHSGRVSDLDFNPDSRILLSAGRDGAIRFWDLENLQKNARQIRELKAPPSIPYSARINPDLPRFVIMGDREGRLVAWRRNQIITNIKLHHSPVLSVAYQPAGKGAFLSAGGDGQLKIRLPEGERATVHAHDGPMFQASYSATGRYVYTVGADRTAKIWDTAQLDHQNPHPRAIMRGHLKYVLTADMSPDEKMLVTGGNDKALNLWEVTSGQLLGHMQGHTSDIESVAFTPNGRIIVSASEDRSVRIWSVDDRQELAMLAFQKKGNEYAGVTFDNRTFGVRDSGLLSAYVDGKQVSRSEAEDVVPYIGHGIRIIEKEE